MSRVAESTFRVGVDPTNPGQFFACCGLLDLADRLWGGAEGWFEKGLFCVKAQGGLEEIIKSLVHELPTEVTHLCGLEIKPIIAPLRLSLTPSISITLDAWMEIKAYKGIITDSNRPWNFWSGQQTPLRIWKSLRDALLKQMKKHQELYTEHLFSQRVPLSGRFGFDPRAAWNALDVGFSPNKQKIGVESSPTVELLAAVGIQRFRPKLMSNRKTFIYETWGHPLSPAVAAAASSGTLPIPPSERFYGRVIDRGNYSALGFSELSKGDDHG